MSNFTHIEIDIEVYKTIEAARQTFAETPNSVLKRLLGLIKGPSATLVQHATPNEQGTQKPWVSDSIELPHGTLLKMEYNHIEYTGQIIDGKWHVEGLVETSPSGAACAVAKTKKGTSTNLDGWKYWNVKIPNTDTWEKLLTLRANLALQELGLEFKLD